ncbi:MAG TPA: DUF3300 domain-containing protein, partial [Stellaceae bacterium]|nr:DUF3300 domain-containing protein [Stellaceae bacterium]
MTSFRLRLMGQALPFLLIAPGIAYAQPVNAPSAAEAAAAANPGAPIAYSNAQLDQMLAPIALYPDQLLMQVLMAATFPQQVIDAGQWLQDPSNAALHGDALASTLEPLPWDPSVKSLVAFPQIIVMMNTHMDWTQALGVAFGGQQVATMARVQFLRNRAAAAGHLKSNAQIKYIHRNSEWIIEPAAPDTIYVPVYNPAVVYGTWPDREYPPVYVPPPPEFVGAGFNLGPGIGFSVGFGVVAPLWGWGHPDWRRHEVVVDQNRYGRITRRDRDPENHIRIENNTWHRTAPVVTVVAPTRERPREENTRRPQGTAAPASVRAPAPSNARPAATPTQAAPGANAPNREQERPNEAHPAPGTAAPNATAPNRERERPNEAHPAPGTAAPNATAPNREHERERSNEPHPAPGTAAP